MAETTNMTANKPEPTSTVGSTVMVEQTNDQKQQQVTDDAAKKRRQFKLEHDKAIAQTVAESKLNAAKGQQGAVPEIVYCAVCGLGSHREDWQGRQGSAQCDSHPKTVELTEEEKVKAGLSNKAVTTTGAGVVTGTPGNTNTAAAKPGSDTAKVGTESAGTNK